MPPGFAHGFLVLTNEAEFLYKCTAYYDPTDEHCLLYNDPTIHIQWPKVSGAFITSPKDAQGKTFEQAQTFD